MDMATDADINIEHRLTEVEQRAKSNTNRLNEHDEILKSNSEMIGAIKEPVSYTHLYAWGSE